MCVLVVKVIEDQVISRSKWIIDKEIPIIKDNRWFIEKWLVTEDTDVIFVELAFVPADLAQAIGRFLRLAGIRLYGWPRRIRQYIVIVRIQCTTAI